MGGEEVHLLKRGVHTPGLPPRGRGRAASGGLVALQYRITPAWAGKSPSGGVSATVQEDYPRVGGEERPPQAAQRKEEGLPPRGRGRAGEGDRADVAGGITPAWAGKSHRRPNPPHRQPDYPRVGGEEERVGRAGRERGGLPPRGRGRVTCRLATWRLSGITPAWAGKRRGGFAWRHLEGDYPRVGGEEVHKREIIGKLRGLPPRGRGRGEEVLPGDTWKGITPAWAGKSFPTHLVPPR